MIHLNRTKIASDGSGSNPKWSEQVVFDVRGNVSECGPVFVQVFHANTLTNDDSIGEVSIAVTKVSEPTQHSKSCVCKMSCDTCERKWVLVAADMLYGCPSDSKERTKM
jgi:hypothetical protein